MGTGTRARLAALTAVVLACPALLVSATSAAVPPAPAAAPPEVPAGFQDTIAIGGLSEPTAVAFAADGTAFIALKTGVIKSFDYNQTTGQFEPFADHVNVTNLDVQVNNYWDRGLTGIAVDPQFGTAGNNFIYVNYAYNRDPRDNPAVVPKWGTAGQQYDECASPAAMPSGPNPAVSGCVINIRVSRIPVAKQASGWVASGAEQPLLEGACMQFPSHASGDVAFGPDGYLYASAGDGASFDTEDWGQANNPCGDPVDEGGSLRSQDIRTSTDPLSISGAIFRMNKANGNAPNGSTSNADRIVTVGQRNPWRLTFRPGTSELWSGDVGGSLWEEINRTDMSSFTGPVNLGWPCYEGSLTGAERQPGWDALDKPVCENLYAAGASAVRAPYFSYRTRGGGLLTPGENCQEGTSSVSGIAFIPSTSTYPAEYRGSLFFNDYARGCIWRLGKLGDGDPDPNTILPFVEAAETPVGIEVGPGGDLFYVDYGIVDGVPTGGAGDIHRIVYTPSNQAPVAALTASAPYGAGLLTVDFDAGGSTDADGDTLTYEWALDGDGVFNDGGGATKTKTYPGAGPRTVQVRVSDGRGGSDTEQVLVTPGNTPPTITAMSPAASLTWSAGQTVGFSATATDAEQSLADSAYSWSLSIQHCPSVCHTHPVQTWVGQRTGSFQAPDHEYPSNLLLQVTVTDNQGLTDVETRQLDPKSVAMTFASNPTGAALTVAGAGVLAPHNQTFIQGSNFNVSAPATRQVGGANYTFASWSDGGAATHAVVAPTTPTTLTAGYTRQNRLPTVTVSANPTSGPAPLTVDLSTNATDPDGDNAGFTYEWALDGDGVFDDGGGATKQKQYATAGSRTVQVRVTDSHGGQDTDQVTVNVGPANQPPVAAIATTPGNPTGPAPFSVSFSASGSSDPDSDPLTYAWDLDNDGAFDDATGVTTSRSYAVGSHVVRVQASDGRGGSDVEQVTVTSTNQAPTARITTTPTTPTGPAPFAVSFSASTSSDPNSHALTYAWDLDNDGAFDDDFDASASRTYAVGTHTVRLQATDSIGATNVATTTVTSTNQPPSAVISPANPSGPAPFTANLNANSSSDANGHALTYAWDLDNDGAFDDSTGPTVSSTYPVGSHTVRLRATDSMGATNVATTTVTSTNQAPVAVISPANPSGPAPFTANLSANSSTDPNGHALTFAWDLDNDGAFDDDFDSSASRTYAVGTHTVRLQATDSIGATNVATTTVTSTNQPPSAVISPANPSGPAPFTANLNANSSSDANGHALTFAWDLDNDGAFDDATGATASRSYAVGTHTVRLQATDSFGLTNVAQTTVTSTNQAPTAVISPANPSGPAPLTVNFDANGSSDPNGHALTFAWDLDNDGAFDDATGSTASGTYPVGDHVARLRATDSIGATNVAQVTVASGNTAPVLGPVTPADGTRWSVGEAIAFSATATDAQDGTLPASAFSWKLEKVECATGCSSVVVATAEDVTSGSFVAPQLGLPSHLLLTVSVVDSRGTPASRTVRLDPRTVDLTFATSPAGLDVDLPRTTATPTTRTVIVGTKVTISAPERQRKGPRLYEFRSWSDGGARTHVVTAPASSLAYVASYEPVRRKVTFLTRRDGLEVKVDGKTRVDGWARRFAVGASVEVTAPKRQWHDGVLYEFVRWSDDGARVHSFLVPEGRWRLRAIYRSA